MLFNAIPPRAGGDALDTEPCPTPASEFCANNSNSKNAATTGVACKECQTNLFNYRHRILMLERDLQFSKQSLENLCNTSARSKRDGMHIFEQMLKENHALKLGLDVAEHVAEIDRARIVSMVGNLAAPLEREQQILKLQEDLRKTIAAKHRAQAAHNTELRALKQRVATLQGTLESATKAHAEESETLRCRLNRLRRGPQVQDLRHVAGAARSLRNTVNRLRMSIVNLVENGPLSSSALVVALGQIAEVATGNVAATVMMSRAGIPALSDNRGLLATSSFLDGMIPAGVGTVSFMAGAFVPPSGNNNRSVTPPPQLSGIEAAAAASSLRPAASMSLFSPPALQIAATQQDTNLRDLYMSVRNYWQGEDEIQLFQDLATMLEDRKAAAAGQSPDRQDTEEGDVAQDDDGIDQKRRKSPILHSNINSGGTCGEKMTESEQMRSALYAVITTLSDQLLHTRAELLRERQRVADVHRHLNSFKLQLREVREGQRPPHSDAAIECFDDDPEFLLSGGGGDSSDASAQQTRSRRGSHWTEDTAGGRTSRTSGSSGNQQQQQNRSSRRGGAAAHMGTAASSSSNNALSRQRKATVNDDDDVVSNASGKSHMSTMSRASRRSSTHSQNSPQLSSLRMSTTSSRLPSARATSVATSAAAASSTAAPGTNSARRRRSSAAGGAAAGASSATATATTRRRSSAALGPATARHHAVQQQPRPPATQQSGSKTARRGTMQGPS